MTKERFSSLLGPVLGFREKSAPNQVTGALVKDFLSEVKREEVLATLQKLGCQDEDGKERDLNQGELENYRCCIRNYYVYHSISGNYCKEYQ